MLGCRLLELSNFFLNIAMLSFTGVKPQFTNENTAVKMENVHILITFSLMVLITSELCNMGSMTLFDGKCCMVTRTELNRCILHCWRSVGSEFKLWELATNSIFMVLRRSQGFSRHHLTMWFSSGAQYVGWSKARCQLYSYDADCVYRPSP